jgi:acyl-[acyl-carrier-protein]-phospholipid O-acyltransferase/long-chain-fatty-acid--[acyl-carrier-protein] ligase
MAAREISLLGKRRFGPLLATSMLGAFNDNLFKTALVVLATYGLFRAAPEQAALLASIATGLFILPFFLFSALAGQIADGWERSRLIRWVKLAELAMMAAGVAGFWLQSLPLLLGVLFLLGVHSAVYGPLKYALLPQHLGADELLSGNAVMEAGGFLAILGGQLLAGVIAPEISGLVACGLAALGWLVSLLIPAAPAGSPGLKLDLNIASASWRLVGEARQIRPVWLCVLGISWFYCVGAVVLGQVVPLVKTELMARQEVAVLFLGLFSVGIAVGSILVNRLLKGAVSARYVPVSAIALAVFLLDLAFAAGGYVPSGVDAGIEAFLATPGAWHIVADLSLMAVAGGAFVIPLYAILQAKSPPAERARIVAANNIMNAGLTVFGVAAGIGLLAAGFRLPALLAAMGFATLVVALIACALLPETLIKQLIKAVLRILYRVELTGAEHMPQPGERAVVVVNHVSYLDALLLAVFLPGKPTFAVHTRVAEAWWMKPVLPLFDAFPVDPTNPMSAKAMVKAVQSGRTLVIFPEGRITVTGALMKVFDGPGMVADKADAPIIPVRVDGAQYTPLSHLKGKVRQRLFPKVRVTVLPPRRFVIEDDNSARERREIAGRKLYDVMSDMMFATSDTNRTLFTALVDARDIHGAKATAVEDVRREPLSYGRLVVGALLLARFLAQGTRRGEAVGLLMPNINGAVAALFGLQAGGRVAAMLNYTAGLANIRAACDAAEIKTVVSARAFVEQAKLEDTVAALEASGRRMVWLEDVAAGAGRWAKMRALVAARFARMGHARLKIDPDSPAVVLFTSGSEGLPKGVALSHRNLLSNCAQVASRIDFNPTDKVLNALPVFHSFGLTGGTLLPLLNGVSVILYPNPLHYRIVPALAYDANATILFGTDTFLAGYASMAHSYDFYSLRYVFAGAERVKNETRAVWGEKFGLRILEGYGATECAPVLAVNTPMHFRPGTVGRLMPGMEARLDPVPGIDEGGRLYVRGPNVMLGYYKADDAGRLQPPDEGWHDTGDICTVDDEGFITIRGRAKRFAKIGGEMVSLTAVETYAAAVWPGFVHAVVSRPDAKKGEQLVLFTTAPDAAVAALQAWARAHGVAELAVPREIRRMAELPVLGTGKTDYVTLAAMTQKETAD